MEGGANAVIEAITSGTPVLASAVDGNIGLLGEDYPGYFPRGDAEKLAQLMLRIRQEQMGDNTLLRRLLLATAKRATLFQPEREAQQVRRWVSDLLDV